MTAIRSLPEARFIAKVEDQRRYARHTAMMARASKFTKCLYTMAAGQDALSEWDIVERSGEAQTLL
jgi:hypothetical protein